MKNFNEINGLDYHSLSPAERAALLSQLIARAHQERSEDIRGALLALSGWLNRVFETVLRAVFRPKIPVPPSRCA